jgi:sugar phosphate isomerase/epimerase
MDRRSFVTLSSLLSAGLISGLAPDSEARSLRKIGLSLRGWTGINSKKGVEELNLIKKLGFNWVEFKTHSPELQYSNEVDNALEQIKKAGLKPLSFDIPLGRGEELHENTPSLKKGLEPLAQKLSEAGCRYVICNRIPQFVRQNLADYEILAQNFNEAGEMCSKYGIQFCYCPGEYDFVVQNDITPFHQLLSQCDKNKVKIKLNLGPILKMQQSLEWLIKAHSGRFPILVLTDFDTKSNQNLGPGKGSFDFKMLLNKSRQAGFESYCLEWQERRPFDYEELAFGIDYLKKLKY